jgi:dephospho-CoA kinase
MLLVGLTGGIGSGKSTVARMLAGRGAVVLDADSFARDAVAPGTRGFRAVAERFPGAIAPEGGLDRRALAEIVFGDEVARRDLEGIVHPAVRRSIAESIAANADADVIVVESPLLVEVGNADDVDVVVVVTASDDARISRLQRERGMTPDDVRARFLAQGPVADKVAVADVVLDNDGSVDELRAQVDRLWEALVARARAPR